MADQAQAIADQLQRLVDDLVDSDRKASRNLKSKSAELKTPAAASRGGKKANLREAREAWELIKWLNNPRHAKNPPGWTTLESGHKRSGLDYGVFRNNRTGRVTVAFNGNNGQNADIASVVMQSVGSRHVAQNKDALAITRRWGGRNVDIVGYSLGGGVAAHVAHATGSDAITFNAQGVQGGGGSGHISHYFVGGEFATGLQREWPLANALPNAPGDNYRLHGGGDPLTLHNPPAVGHGLATTGGVTSTSFGPTTPAERDAQTAWNNTIAPAARPIVDDVVRAIAPSAVR